MKKCVCVLLFFLAMCSVAFADVQTFHFQGGGYVPNSDYLVYVNVSASNATGALTFCDHGSCVPWGVQDAPQVVGQYVVSDSYGNLDFNVDCEGCTGYSAVLPVAVSADDSFSGDIENNAQFVGPSVYQDGDYVSPFRDNPLFGQPPSGGSSFVNGLPLQSSSPGVSNLLAASNIGAVTAGVVTLFLGFVAVGLYSFASVAAVKYIHKGKGSL